MLSPKSRHTSGSHARHTSGCHATSVTSITSGVFRGRKIATPDNGLTHPMGAREKLALFNSIESLRGPLDGASVLDCFCGSGALGIEAISRGATSVVFVDKDRQAIATTKQNLASLGLKSQDNSISKHNLTPATHFSSSSSDSTTNPTNSLANRGDSAHAKNSPNITICHENFQNLSTLKQFDLILADPPYDNFPSDLSILSKILRSGGILALSHPTSVNPTDLLPDLELVRTKSYALANLSIFVKHEG